FEREQLRQEKGEVHDHQTRTIPVTGITVPGSYADGSKKCRVQGITSLLHKTGKQSAKEETIYCSLMWKTHPSLIHIGDKKIGYNPIDVLGPVRQSQLQMAA